MNLTAIAHGLVIEAGVILLTTIFLLVSPLFHLSTVVLIYISQYIDSKTENEEFQACRYCSTGFKFKIKDKILNILGGPPAADDEYCALSHVWGDAPPLSIKCQNCSKTTTFPMTSMRKFKKLLCLGAENLKLWLDALSIDQSDEDDIARQVAMMGDIYKNANYVGVLLPAEDEPLYQSLHDATVAAVIIHIHRFECFSQNKELHGLGLQRGFQHNAPDLLHGQPLHSDYTGLKCSELVYLFFMNLWKFWNGLDKSAYWRRAWTFQEWALAKDLLIRCESTMCEAVLQPKGHMMHAAVLIARYRMMYHHQDAEIHIADTRGQILQRLDVIRRFFPLEDFYRADHEIDEEVLSRLIRQPYGVRWTSETCDRPLYGLRGTSEPRQGDDMFLARLNLMLDAYGVVKKKQAKFDADLICCWASMCNIKYDYRKDDSFVVALQKVLVVLRSRGLRIYNFVPNTEGASGEIDRAFLDYAATHWLSNADDYSRIPGLPIFTGAMDTCRHIQSVVTSTSTTARFAGRGVRIRRVVGASHPILEAVSLSDWQAVKGIFLPRVTGKVGELGNSIGLPPHDSLKEALEALGRDHDLSRYTFAAVSIPARNKDGKIGNVMIKIFWAVFESKFLDKRLFVALEEMNQTLVLATCSEGRPRIVAYLVLTDLQAGSHLLTVNDKSNISVKLGVRERADQWIVHPRAGTRDFIARIKIEKESILAY